MGEPAPVSWTHLISRLHGRCAAGAWLSWLGKYDTNRNGVLDESERAAMKAARDVFLTGVQLKVLDAYDRNFNGRLDPEEQSCPSESVPPWKPPPRVG